MSSIQKLPVGKYYRERSAVLLSILFLTITTGIARGGDPADKYPQSSIHTVKDALAVVAANYKQISDLTFDTQVYYSVDKKPQGNPAQFHVQQKGGYMSRQTQADTGVVTVMNGGKTAYFDNQGRYQGGFEADTIGNMLSGVSSNNGAPYYWDVEGFYRDFPGIGTNSVERGSGGLVTFQAVPKDTTTVTRITYTMDCQQGIPVEELTSVPGGGSQRILHGAPSLVGTNIWLPTEETATTTEASGLAIEWRSKISNIKVNQGLADSLFAIPKPPK